MRRACSWQSECERHLVPRITAKRADKDRCEFLAICADCLLGWSDCWVLYDPRRSNRFPSRDSGSSLTRSCRGTPPKVVGIEQLLICEKPTPRPIRMSGGSSEKARSGGRCARTCWNAWREASGNARRLTRLRGSIATTRRGKIFAPSPGPLSAPGCRELAKSEGPTGLGAISPTDFPR